MEKNNQNLIAFTATGTMNASDRKCSECGCGIPPERRRDAKFCSDSCKTRHSKNKNGFSEDVTSNETLSESRGMDTNICTSALVENIQPPPNTPLMAEKAMEWYETYGNNKVHEKKTLCKVAKQMEQLVKKYEKQGLLEIPKNEVLAILPTSYPIDKFEKISLPDCALRLVSNKNNFLICKNRSLWS